ASGSLLPQCRFARVTGTRAGALTSLSRAGAGFRALTGARCALSLAAGPGHAAARGGLVPFAKHFAKQFLRQTVGGHLPSGGAAHAARESFLTRIALLAAA